jgi:hypothetical protein
MKIARLEVLAIGGGPDVDPDKGGVGPLACVRVHTDEGPTGLSEVFRVPPGVVQATVGGPDTHLGRLLLGQEVTHPDRNGSGNGCGPRSRTPTVAGGRSSFSARSTSRYGTSMARC